MGPAVVRRQLSAWEVLRHRLVATAFWFGKYLADRDPRLCD